MSKEERFERRYDFIIDKNKRNTGESLIVYDIDTNTLNDLCELLNQLDRENKVLEKALDLACEEIRFMARFIAKHSEFNLQSEDFITKRQHRLANLEIELKTKAKEMIIKSE